MSILLNSGPAQSNPQFLKANPVLPNDSRFLPFTKLRIEKNTQVEQKRGMKERKYHRGNKKEMQTSTRLEENSRVNNINL